MYNVPVHGVVANAANIKEGINPPYTIKDFYDVYPQFENLELLGPEIVEMYIGLANAYLNIDRYKSVWKIAMCLFIAHFCTLFLQSTTPVGSSAKEVIAAGQSKGLISSKSVGDVSVSYDYSMIAQGLENWAGWTLTAYGVQLASLAKIAGKGGMYVY